MKKAIKSAVCLLVALSCVVGVTGCKKKTEETTAVFSRVGYVLGTSATIALSYDISDTTAPERAEDLWVEVGATLEQIENSLSSAITTSSIYKFNQANAGETVTIDKTAYTVLSEALRLNAYTNGYYNPGVYYSVDLYGFAPRGVGVSMPYDRTRANAELPDEDYVQAFKELGAYFKDIELNENKGVYTAKKPVGATVNVKGVDYHLKIDLGGIGKGYAVDLIDKMIDDAGFEYSYFNLGSSSIAVNSFSEKDPNFNMSSQDPRSNALFSVESYISRKVNNVCLSTSGDYEKYYILDDVRYCHIINPTTGRPISDGVITATLIGGTAMEGDALTTALTCMGRDNAISFINEKLSAYTVTFVYEKQDKSLQIISNTPTSAYTQKNKKKFKIAYTLDSNGKIIYNNVN